MAPSKLGIIVAILAITAGFSAFAGSAAAQISGSTGGNVVASDPVKLQPTHGTAAFQWGLPDPLLPGMQG
jgi:hypothetical protein